MHNNDTLDFFHLNRDGRWPNFELFGLERSADGSLQLYSVPRLKGSLPATIGELPTPIGPTGIAVGSDNTIYFSDTDGHRVLKITLCEDIPTPVPCIGGEGGEPGQFRNPRGLLFHPRRQLLIVVDSGNHRLQLFDIGSFQFRGTWGQPKQDGEPMPSDEPGRFNQPWSLDGDSNGYIYIADYGNSRIQKFDMLGRVVVEFWNTVQSEASELSKPREVAVVERHGKYVELYVLDGDEKESRKVFVFDEGGHLLRNFELSMLEDPMGLRVVNEAVYVGDNGRRRLYQFRPDGTFVGEAQGYEGPVAALAMDFRDHLWLHPGGEEAPVTLEPCGSHIRSGSLWGGPFGDEEIERKWHEIKARVTLDLDSHVRFFIYTAVNAHEAPPAPLHSDVQDPFHILDKSPWHPLPLNSPQGIIPGNGEKFLWVGVHFMSEGKGTPTLKQIKLIFNHETYIKYLPAIYQRDSQQREIMERFLSLFESFFSNSEEGINNLSAYFDPEALPEEWLPWLASWLGLELNANWSVQKQRQAIGRAFESYAKQGTADGLREALQFFTAVDAVVIEPIRHANWWCLPDISSETADYYNKTSILGSTTMLVSAEAQGAVVGTTAILDRSHLISQEEIGGPLFERVAHQFSVYLYRSQINGEEHIAEIRDVIEAEKPAHTLYQLCIVEPTMRLGVQATIGLDSVLGAALPPKPLDDTGERYSGLVLVGDPPRYLKEGAALGRRLVK